MPMPEKLTKEEARQFLHIKDTYLPVERIGEGTFSTVYKAIDMSKNETIQYVAIKNITRTSAPNRVAEEIQFLRDLKGKDNVIELLSCRRYEDQILAIFPHFEFTEYRSFIEDCTIVDIKHYVYNLLVAVHNTDVMGIIHRDIKPSNFLYNKSERRGVLIDYGLAQYEKENKIAVEERKEKKPSVMFFNNTVTRNLQPPGYNIGDGRPQMRAPRAGTRGFRAPEVLLRVQAPTRKIDVWSVGVILLSLVTRQYPFFNSQDDLDALVEVANIFGKDEMKRVAKYYGRVFKTNIASVPGERVAFETMVKSMNPGFEAGIEVFDLLYLLLDLYSEKRITAEAALQHPFFSDIK